MIGTAFLTCPGYPAEWWQPLRGDIHVVCAEALGEGSDHLELHQGLILTTNASQHWLWMLMMTAKWELRLSSHNHAAQSSLNAYRKNTLYKIRHIHTGVTLQRISRYRALLEQKNSGSSCVRTASQHLRDLHELWNSMSLNPCVKLRQRLLCLAAPKAHQAHVSEAGWASASALHP